MKYAKILKRRKKTGQCILITRRQNNCTNFFIRIYNEAIIGVFIKHVFKCYPFFCLILDVSVKMQSLPLTHLVKMSVCKRIKHFAYKYTFSVSQEES